jgi:hypothetical protein
MELEPWNEDVDARFTAVFEMFLDGPRSQTI